MKCPDPAISLNCTPFNIIGFFQLIYHMAYTGAFQFEAFGKFGLGQSRRAEDIGKCAPLGTGQAEFCR